MLSKTFASLRLDLSGTALQPEDVTARLGIAPSHSHQIGDPHGSRGLLYPNSIWILSSRNHATSTDLEEHIAWILDQIEPRQEAFMAIRGALPTADVFCMAVSRYSHSGLEFSPRLMGRLATLGLALGLDIYFGGEKKQDSADA
jgi:hypothetical protein